MSSKPINVGLIGYGFSVHCFHAPFIVPNPELNIYAFLQRKDAPSDPSSAKPRSHCTIDYPKAKHYQKEEDFFNDEAIELVIVCSHTDTHARFAEMALKKGKNVVVEKPFTRTSEEADALIEVAKKSGKLLTCFQNRRYDGGFQTLQNLIAKGSLGQLTELENSYYIEDPPWVRGFPTKYEAGSGMLFGLGTHTLDQVLLLFGRPARITCFHRANRNGGVESNVDDTFTVILEYEGKNKQLLVTVKTGIISVMEEQLSIHARGTEGSYLKFGERDAQELHAIQGKPATDPDFGVEDPSLHGLLTTLKKADDCQTYDETRKKYIGKIPTVLGKYTGYYDNIVAAIRGRGELYVKPEESRDGLRLIELARESAETHRSVEWR